MRDRRIRSHHRRKPITWSRLRKTQRGFDADLDLAVLDQTDFTRTIEPENRRERILVIDGAGESRRSP